MMQNSIMTIRTYRHNGLWVFDDAAVDLVREPFVAGADTALDIVAEGANAVVLIFSALPFPGHKLTLHKVKGGPETGTDYRCAELDHDMWLCPALNKYFQQSPDVIYVDYKPEVKSAPHTI